MGLSSPSGVPPPLDGPPLWLSSTVGLFLCGGNCLIYESWWEAELTSQRINKGSGPVSPAPSDGAFTWDSDPGAVAGKQQGPGIHSSEGGSRGRAQTGLGGWLAGGAGLAT